MSSSSSFGAEFDNVWPTKQPKLTKFCKELLKKCENIKKPDNVTISEIIENSNKFPVKFPIDTCRIKSQPKERYIEIEKQINSVYPIIHERVLWLYLRFLEHKMKFGNKIDKEVYTSLGLCEFVQRLLSKRCVTFYGKNDKYLLLDGSKGTNGFNNIGTKTEFSPLVLEKCLSYDEIKLSALLSVSSHMEFINDGSRMNRGEIPVSKSGIEESGVIIGVIGARLSQLELMEFQDIVISKSQNIAINGYGPKVFESNAMNFEILKKIDYRKMYNEFYEEKDFLFTDLKKNGKRFGNAKSKENIFDNLLMKKRFTISFDTLLLESEARAAALGKQAYIHLVGFGLGVWKTAQQQDEIFMETFEQRLKSLLPKLKHISYVHFSWFLLEEWGDLKDGQVYKSEDHPSGGIKILISKRNPADKLKSSENENCLLIVTYAWDGNAQPGNEFWMNKLSSSGDSSTACSTLVSELHNSHINDRKACGNNLHIASEKYGVLHISDYIKISKNLE